MVRFFLPRTSTRSSQIAWAKFLLLSAGTELLSSLLKARGVCCPAAKQSRGRAALSPPAAKWHPPCHRIPNPPRAARPSSAPHGSQGTSDNTPPTAHLPRVGFTPTRSHQAQATLPLRAAGSDSAGAQHLWQRPQRRPPLPRHPSRHISLSSRGRGEPRPPARRRFVSLDKFQHEQGASHVGAPLRV